MRWLFPSCWRWPVLSLFSRCRFLFIPKSRRRKLWFPHLIPAPALRLWQRQSVFLWKRKSTVLKICFTWVLLRRTPVILWLLPLKSVWTAIWLRLRFKTVSSRLSPNFRRRLPVRGWRLKAVHLTRWASLVSFRPKVHILSCSCQTTFKITLKTLWDVYPALAKSMFILPG